MSSLQNVDTETDANLIVFGYFRINKYDIPSSLISLCINYYFQPEQFEIAGNGVIISNENKTITYSKGECKGCCTSYGKHIIPSTSNYIYEWHLKINETISNHCYIKIGITSDTKTRDGSFTYEVIKVDSDHIAFGYWSCNGNIFDSRLNCPSRGLSYNGCKFDQGDIIKITLNLKTKQISYSVNDKDQGIASENIPCNHNIKYRLAVLLADKYLSVSILKFCKFTHLTWDLL
eukprot:34250_1